MKFFVVTAALLLLTGNLRSDEADFKKDGALLWGENCMGCHIPRNFLSPKPDEKMVEELAETIEVNIYSPESGMASLNFLKADQIDDIARFLIYGSHGDGWIHGRQAMEYGTETCYSCHDNPRLYENPPPNCNSCHG